MARKPTGKPTGRPPAKISRKQFEELCKIHCTRQELAAVFGVNVDTISAWCEREYGEAFSTVYERYKEMGKKSMRRIAWDRMKKSDKVLIFMMQNHLGMKEEQAIEHKGEGIRIINDIPQVKPDGGTTD